ncbi:MAG: type II secretion system F family protein [Dehalococcoidia bacterium]
MRSSTTNARVKEPKANLLSFRYIAHGSQNRVVKGTVRANSEISAQHLLVERGLTPVSIDPIPSPLSLEGALPTFFGIKPAQIVTFSRQLSTLLESGVSLLPALQLLESQISGSQAFGRVVRAIAQDLGTGKSFAQAIARHPAAFNDIYVRTLSVGERTGQLEAVLKQMADYMEKQSAFGKKLSKALAYPIMVLAVGLIVSVILLVVVLPPLTELFVAMNVALPLPTRILMATSEFFTAYITYIGAITTVSVVAFIWFSRRPRGRQMLDQFRLNAPLLGTPTRMAELARICRTMEVLLSAGLSLQEVIELLPQTSTNSAVKLSLQNVRRGLLLGEGLTQPMSADPFFPPLMLQMVRVGEESNSLEKNLAVLADFYETTSDEKTAALIGMVTPMATIGIAVFAGFIALSVIMPMYEITGAIDLE